MSWWGPDRGRTRGGPCIWQLLPPAGPAAALVHWGQSPAFSLFAAVTFVGPTLLAGSTVLNGAAET